MFAKYAKDQNISLEMVYEDLTKFMVKNSKANEWNATKEALKFYETKADITKGSLYLNITSSEEPNYLMKLMKMYSKLLLKTSSLDWSTKNIGSLYVRMLVFQLKVGLYFPFLTCKNMKAELESHLTSFNRLFTLNEDQISLPEIAHLYTNMDFKQLSQSQSVWGLGYQTRMDLPSSFTDCFENLTQIVYGKTKNNQDSVYYNSLGSEELMTTLPCILLDLNPQCQEYCSWHEKMTKTWNTEDFLTMMRFTMPQRKIRLEEIKPFERQLAEKVLGKNRIGNLTTLMSPIAMPYLCHKDNKGFYGDDIGMSEKVCNDFFPAPTDQGICLTKDSNINEFLKPTKHFNLLFEADKQKSSQYFDGGVLWSGQTFVLNTDGYWPEQQIYNRDTSKVIGKIQMQIHQSNEIANMAFGTRDDETTVPFELDAGFEYWIDVSPTGQLASESYQKVALNQRNCLLESEVDKSSIFTKYTHSNCKYDCHTKKAMETCKCAPWDFISSTNAPECDVFGRTCFYVAMKNFSKSLDKICNHCKDDCNYIQFKKTMIKKEATLTPGLGPKYYLANIAGGKCFGSQVFCDFMLDTNNTFRDHGLENALESLNYKIDSEHYENVYKIIQNFVIVHLRYKTPDIQMIDLKYSTMDHLASFGGNFGIFAEVTGCSFLVMINIFFILVKMIFSKFRSFLF